MRTGITSHAFMHILALLPDASFLVEEVAAPLSRILGDGGVWNLGSAE